MNSVASARKRSVVLLSSGLDSTVNLYEARATTDVVLALTFDYGQRAAPRETERAARIAKRAGVPHKVVSLPWFKDFTHTSLVDREHQVPVSKAVSIDDMGVSHQTAKAVWVPNRNGIMLNVAAGFAEGLGADWIVPGFNVEEAATFPDNTDAFLKALTHSFSYSTANKLEAVCFTTSLNKTEIVKRGRVLEAPFDLMWPCYFPGEPAAGMGGDFKTCGQCESCQRFARANSAAGPIGSPV
jgi:7-cyano-7-deazaguanine synthase